MPHSPAAGMLPASSLVSPTQLAPAWSQLPPAGTGVPQFGPSQAAPPQPDFPRLAMAQQDAAAFASSPERGDSRSGREHPETARHRSTLGVWLIGVLPLLQFAVVYAIFGPLAFGFVPGTQWGILAAPAAFSLLFALLDRKALIDGGNDAPSPLFAVIPPLYLLVRCFRVGPSSIGPLLVWIVLQAGAVGGVVYLLPVLLSAAVGSIR